MNINSVNHFLKLARRGKFPGAFDGEVSAYRLAEAIFHELESLSRIDGQANEGVQHLISAVSAGGYETVNDILGGIINKKP